MIIQNVIFLIRDPFGSEFLTPSKQIWWATYELILSPERLERGGPRWPLKLRWMGTQRVQMKEVLPWLVRWACCSGTRDFSSALAALVGTVQNIFSSQYSILVPLSKSPSKMGRQPYWVSCLLVCVSDYVVRHRHYSFSMPSTRQTLRTKTWQKKHVY